jgi:hypothetical protein
MNLKIYEHSANYTATVVKLPVKQAVEGLDNLVMVEIFGNKCLIGKDSDESQLYLFFPSGTQLSPAFLKGNNLYRENQLNEDTNQKGFFELNGRVKAIKFRGIISSGFVIPVHSLKNLWTNGIDRDWACGEIVRLKEGDSFNECDHEEVCRKYVINVPAEPGQKKDRVTKVNNQLVDLMIPNQFRFHSDTSHLANNLHQINPDDMILITDKWHGSSSILSKVLINKKLNLWQKFLNLIGGKIPNKEYGYIYSSGKPKSNLPKGIEGAWINKNQDYYSSNIWKRAFDDYKHALEDGISIYGELVGFEESGSAIQKGYDYGCVPHGLKGTIVDGVSVKETPGSYRMVVYRITYTKPDGSVIEFTWPQIREYCKKYNLETVKEIYFGKLKDWVFDYRISRDEPTIEQFREMFFQQARNMVETLGNCRYCSNKVPAEGWVFRKDGGQAFKLKASLFLKKESDDLDKGETNIEDNA